MLTDLYHGHDSSLLPRLNAPAHVTDSAIMLARTWADFRWAEEATHELGSQQVIIIILLYFYTSGYTSRSPGLKTKEAKIKMSDGQRSGRSTGRVSCKSTELKRCSMIEMRWNKYEVSLASPV